MSSLDRLYDAPMLGSRLMEEDTVRVGEGSYSLRELVGVVGVSGTMVELVRCSKTSVGCMGGGERRLVRDRVKVGDAGSVVEEVRRVLRSAYPASPRKALVVVNPKGGTGQARRVYERDVRPIFEAAGLKVDLLVTSRPREAMDRCRALAAERFPKNNTTTSRRPSLEAKEDADIDCIVVVGGDGTAFECVNGLWEGCGGGPKSVVSDSRRRREEAAEFASKLSTIPIGHIPAGSGNALAESVARAHGDRCTPCDAAYAVVKGTVVPLDLAEYELADGSVVPSFLSFEWAMLADVDLGSESMRCLGDLRFQLAAVYRICCLKKYEGTLAYLPFQDDINDPTTYESRPVDLPRLDNLTKESQRQNSSSTEASDASSLLEKWVVVDATNFHLLVATNLSHLDANTPIAPRALPDDGALHLVWTAGDTSSASKLSLTSLLLNLDQGKHVDSPFVHVAKCRAFRLEPAANSTSRAAIDGEEIPNATIQASLRPSCLRVFASPPLLREVQAGLGPPSTVAS